MIQDYINHITKKRDEIGGHAICPYANAFLKKTNFIESNNFRSDASKIFRSSDHPMLSVIYGDPKKYNKKWLCDFCEEYQYFATSKNLWLIWDHPDQINKINGVQTNNNEYAILLIQKLDETKKFSKKLEQKTDYYSYWSAGYFEEIVKKRDSL